MEGGKKIEDNNLEKNKFLCCCGPFKNEILTLIALTTVYQAIKSLSMLCNFYELFNAAKKESDVYYKLYPYIIQLLLLWSGNYYF